MKRKIVPLAMILVLAFGGVLTFLACERPVQEPTTFRIAFNMQEEWQREFGVSYPQVGIVAREDIALANPLFVSEVVSMIQQSMNFAKDNPQAVANIVVNELNSTELRNVAAIQTFVARDGADIFNFQTAVEAQTAACAFLGRLSLGTIGGSVPDEEFYFNVPSDATIGTVEGSFGLHVPDGAPLIAAAHAFYTQSSVLYGQNQIYMNFVPTTGAAIGSALVSGAADFALVPMNLAATRFNVLGTGGHRYVLVGIALWGIQYLVENYAHTGGIDSLNDLVGEKIVAFQPNLTPGVVLETILTQAGLSINRLDTPHSTLDPNAVNIYYHISNAAVRNAMLGRVAAFAGGARFALLAEPMATELLLMSEDDIYLE